MKKITTFNKENVVQIRKELEAAISSVCEKHGLKNSSLGTISFGKKDFTTGKLMVFIKEDVSLSSIEPKTLIGNSYKLGQRIFNITGVNSDGTLTASTNRGARYKLRIDQLEKMLKL